MKMNLSNKPVAFNYLLASFEPKTSLIGTHCLHMNTDWPCLLKFCFRGKSKKYSYSYVVATKMFNNIFYSGTEFSLFVL